MEYKVLYRNSDGVKRTMIEDTEKPGQLQVFTEVEMDEVIASVNRDREAEQRSYDGGKFPANRLLARVPMTIYEQSLLEQWDEARWTRWLNDPDNAAFRIWQGNV